MIGLIGLGLSLIVYGVQSWLDHRAAARVAKTFLQALRDGDRELALSQLSTAQRQAVEDRTDHANSSFWSPEPEMNFRLMQTQIDGDTAFVQYWINKNGFVLKPIFHLRRNETRSWKIVRIENLQIDPRWLDLENERARQAGENLANELAKALKERPGTTVERKSYPVPKAK